MEQEVELLTELMQSLTRDVADLKKLVATPPAPAPPLDMRPTLDKVTKAINELRQEVAELSQRVEAGSSADLKPRFDALSQQIRQRPEYRLSQYVRYGGYVFGLLVVVLMGMSWLAFEWKSEREQYAQANWRVRYVRQIDPGFYGHIEALFRKDLAGVQQWTLEQEQADEKRAIAQEAAEQANVMNAQADQLEGKATTKGNKRESR